MATRTQTLLAVSLLNLFLVTCGCAPSVKDDLLTYQRDEAEKIWPLRKAVSNTYFRLAILQHTTEPTSRQILLEQTIPGQNKVIAAAMQINARTPEVRELKRLRVKHELLRLAYFRFRAEALKRRDPATMKESKNASRLMLEAEDAMDFKHEELLAKYVWNAKPD